jgi:hypothetical protein
LRKSPGFKIALSLFFLASTSWAQLNLNADPRWRALMSGPLGAATPVAAHRAKNPGPLKSTCTATANCDGGGTVSCSGSGTCTAVDQSCPETSQGYVDCGSGPIYCQDTCKIPPDCSIYNFGSCNNYTWNATTQCCVATREIGFCPDACF